MFGNLLSFMADRFLTTVKFKLALVSTAAVQWFLRAFSRAILLMEAGSPEMSLATSCTGV